VKTSAVRRAGDAGSVHVDPKQSTRPWTTAEYMGVGRAMDVDADSFTRTSTDPSWRAVGRSLRNAAALSCILQKPIRVSNIRGRQSNARTQEPACSGTEASRRCPWSAELDERDNWIL